MTVSNRSFINVNIVVIIKQLNYLSKFDFKRKQREKLKLTLVLNNL
jgi:hypothetical protein